MTAEPIRFLILVGLLISQGALGQERSPGCEPESALPVSIYAQTSLSKEGGLVTNQSSRNIIKLCGVFIYRDPSDKTEIETRWSYSYSGPFVIGESYLAAGETMVMKPRNMKGSRSRLLEYVSFSTTGLVFEDFTVAGLEGDYCRQRLKDVGRASHMQLAEIQRLRDRAPKRFEAMLGGTEPMVNGYNNRGVHTYLRRLLLDDRGELRDNHQLLLDRLVNRLREF